MVDSDAKQIIIKFKGKIQKSKYKSLILAFSLKSFSIIYLVKSSNKI